MDTDVIYAVRCTTSVLIFPILVHLSSYQETVLIDICKCKASSSTLISHTISIKIIVLKIINLKSSLYLVPYIWNFLHIPELKLVIPIVLFAIWIRPFRFVRDNLNLFSCIVILIIIIYLTSVVNTGCGCPITRAMAHDKSARHYYGTRCIVNLLCYA